MKQMSIVLLIFFGAIVLYCAKVFIQASIVAPYDSLDAYYSIIGWMMYTSGLILFIGGIVAQGVKIVRKLIDNDDEL